MLRTPAWRYSQELGVGVWAGVPLTCRNCSRMLASALALARVFPTAFGGCEEEAASLCLLRQGSQACLMGMHTTLYMHREASAVRKRSGGQGCELVTLSSCPNVAAAC